MSTAMVTRAAPRFLKPLALGGGGFVMWAGADPNTVTTDVRFEYGTGAPSHTSPQGSVYVRTDAADSDTLFYRNTDGAATWEAVVGAELTDLLAAANTWAALQTLTTGARVVDSGAIQFGTAGGDLVLTADGTGVTITGTGPITIGDGVAVQRVGAGTGTGDVIERIGGTATEGLELVVFNAVISPAAVETAVLTVPAGSFVLAVQSNVATALTGGGTTVTYSLGTAADPDKYGTPASDALTQNTKSNFMGPFAFLPSAEAIVLTGTATGGAADGDTALTVGSVRVRVVYYTLNSLDNA